MENLLWSIAGNTISIYLYIYIYIYIHRHHLQILLSDPPWFFVSPLRSTYVHESVASPNIPMVWADDLLSAPNPNQDTIELQQIAQRERKEREAKKKNH